MNGYDKAIVQSFTPNFVNIMIEYKTIQGMGDLPTSSVVAEFSDRYRDLLGITGNTDTPASYGLQMNKGAEVKEMMSFDVRPILYKKALLDLDILDETKTYTLEEWNKIPKLKLFSNILN
ncbi:hypothetical protein Plhal703r1_c21g0093021 [Plasmopara halstedii]